MPHHEINVNPGDPLVSNGSDADFTVVDIDDCQSVPAYEAELIFLRHGLGIGSFGMQVERQPEHYQAYAQHDESDSGQEEIYTLIEGSARLLVGGDEHALRPGVFARVGPNTRRKIVTDEPPPWTDPNQRAS
jgi:hypothetical protein